MELFVQHGFASLLDEIGSLEVKRRLEEGKWHAFGDKSRPGLYFEADLDSVNSYRPKPRNDPMLLTALKREAPNMEIVRLLVEKFDIDVNEFRYAWEYLNNARYDLTQQGTALHELASGKHWWHAALAIPYLISKGADVDAKGKGGRTPLHIALGGPDNHVGPFHKDAAQALIIAGANVNSRDERGISCLAYTGGDLEMVQLLLHCKAVVTADALFMALHARRIDVLETLLKT